MASRGSAHAQGDVIELNVGAARSVALNKIESDTRYYFAQEGWVRPARWFAVWPFPARREAASGKRRGHSGSRYSGWQYKWGHERGMRRYPGGPG